MNALMADLRSELRPLFGVTIGLMLLTAVAYPLAVTGIGQLAFNHQANGSIVEVGGVAVGSSLLGQQFSGEQYFHPRPSAAGGGYDAANSSGSNLGPTSDKLINGVADDTTTGDTDESFDGFVQRAAAYREENGLDPDAIIPADAVTASASGLDPHISPANALLQAGRVANARGATPGAIQDLVDDFTERPFVGFIGQPRVNVLELNIALDTRFPATP